MRPPPLSPSTARGGAAGDLLEHAVEPVERGGDLLARRRRDGVAGALHAVEPRRVGEERAQRALGERAHRQRRGDAARRRDRLDRPRLEVHDALALQRARAHGDRLAVLARTSPTPAARRTRSCRSSSSSAASSWPTTSVQRRRREGLPSAPAASLSTARASDSRLCHATASRNAGSRATAASRASSSGPKASSPSTGKPELRTAKSGHRLQSSLREIH